MSEDAIKNHAIHQTLQAIADLFNTERLKSLEISTDQGMVWKLQKLYAIVSMWRSGLKNCPSTLISLNGLNNLNNAAQTARQELANFASNGNVTHFNNGFNQLDGALQWTWAIPIVQSELRIADAFRDGEHFRGVIADLQQDLRREREAYSKEVAALKNEAELAKNRLIELSKAAEQERAGSITAVAELKAQYSRLESELEKRFTDELAEIAARASSQQDGLAKQFFEWQESSKTHGEELLARMQSSQKEAETIVQIVGNIGVTGNYQKLALSERAAATVWRRITLAIFAVSILLVSIAIWTFHGGPDWHLALVRLLAAIGLSTPAYYTARESARHRTTADAASRAELELASLGPFIQSLTDQDQAQIRKDLAKAYFGQATKEHDVKEMFTLKDLKGLADVLDRNPEVGSK